MAKKDKAIETANEEKVIENAEFTGGKTFEEHGVYEPTDTTKTKSNPYDLKAGGKPACMLADGTRPEVVTSESEKA